jgi:hypothetical protein
MTMAAKRKKGSARKPGRKSAPRRKAPGKSARRRASAPGKAARVLGVDVASYARQLLAESGGDVHRAKDELEATLAALREHLHAWMEVKMRTVRIPGPKPWTARAVDPFDAE